MLVYLKRTVKYPKLVGFILGKVYDRWFKKDLKIFEKP